MTATAAAAGTIARHGDPLDVPSVADVVAGWEVSKPLTVAEAAELLDINPHTVRYYERAGLMQVNRSASGHRRYDGEALRRLLFLIRMRSSGMSIADLQRYVELVDGGEVTVPERREMMLRHRQQIVDRIGELQSALAVTDYKIETYGAP